VADVAWIHDIDPHAHYISCPPLSSKVDEIRTMSSNSRAVAPNSRIAACRRSHRIANASSSSAGAPSFGSRAVLGRRSQHTPGAVAANPPTHFLPMPLPRNPNFDPMDALISQYRWDWVPPGNPLPIRIQPHRAARDAVTTMQHLPPRVLSLDNPPGARLVRIDSPRSRPAHLDRSSRPFEESSVSTDSEDEAPQAEAPPSRDNVNVDQGSPAAAPSAVETSGLWGRDRTQPRRIYRPRDWRVLDRAGLSYREPVSGDSS
jgi:hypothetical protein